MVRREWFGFGRMLAAAKRFYLTRLPRALARTREGSPLRARETTRFLCPNFYILLTNFRFASAFSSVYLAVICNEECPEISITSLRLPPTLDTIRAAFVMKVRLPE